MTTASIAIRKAMSLEAEQSVLGGLMLDNTAFADVAALLDPGSFGHRPYGLVFGAIAALVAAHDVADIITVFERLERFGQADEVGGLAHLNALVQSVPSAAGTVRYARRVADHAQRRALLCLAEEIPELVTAADSTDAAIDQIQARLGQLQQAKAMGEPASLGAFVHQAVAEINAIAAGDVAPGLATGLPAIDKALGGGLKPGRVYTIAARTSVGKTSLATQILLTVGTAGHPGLMLSQEMTGAELAARAIAHRGGVALDRLTLAELTPEEWGRLPGAADDLVQLPVWIDDRPALRLVDIAAKARAIQRRHGLSVLVIDYLQLCAAEAVKGLSRHHQIEAISRGLKALAKELGVAVLLLSQLNRSAEDGEPELHHLKESGAVEEDADAVLLLFPMGNEPNGAQVVCCKVAKNRGGKRGRLALSFDGRYQTWRTSQANVARPEARRG